MPSLFTRARTTSAKKLPKTPAADGHGPDEFGRVTSRGSTTGGKERRTRKQSTTGDRNGGEDELPEVMEDGYLPTSVEPPELPQQTYGYLSHGRQVVLGIEDVTRLVEIVSGELGARGKHPILSYFICGCMRPSTLAHAPYALYHIILCLFNSEHEESCL